MNPTSPIHDIAIVGGGITGAGVALKASLSGYRVALFEQYDFGFGASSATSKLAHGGLRYLENREFKLVRESLSARNDLLLHANHAVKPLEFYIPIYKNSKWKPWQLKVGLTIYDWLQPKGQLPKHRLLQSRQLLNQVPWLQSDGLIGCASYYDAQMADHRLLIETLLMAKSHGALIDNYQQVVDFESKSSGVGFDTLDAKGVQHTHQSKALVVATGAWNNQVSKSQQVNPTKGVHIVLPDMQLSQALLLMTPSDQRVFFVLPWQGKTLVGTTDTPNDGQYHSPKVTQLEAQYLLDSLNAYNTKRNWVLSDIQSAFCGYRPLISGSEGRPSKRTREESYRFVNNNVLAVSGGKYTTFLNMADRAVQAIETHCGFNQSQYVFKQYPSFMGQLDGFPSDAQFNQLVHRYHINADSLMYLIEEYGSIYKQILAICEHNKNDAVRFDLEYPMIIAQLQYAIAHEWVKEPEDFLLRRTTIGYEYAKNSSLITAITKQFYQLTHQIKSVSDIKCKVQSILKRVAIEDTIAT